MVDPRNEVKNSVPGLGSIRSEYTSTIHITFESTSETELLPLFRGSISYDAHLLCSCIRGNCRPVRGHAQRADRFEPAGRRGRRPSLHSSPRGAPEGTVRPRPSPPPPTPTSDFRLQTSVYSDKDPRNTGFSLFHVQRVKRLETQGVDTSITITFQNFTHDQHGHKRRHTWVKTWVKT